MWISDFGREWTHRNEYDLEELDNKYQEWFGDSRSFLNQEFLGDLDRGMRILEVGCNVGIQCEFLQRMGFSNLYGIDVQSYALEIGKRIRKGINFIKGDILDIPFKDNYFDLIFTSGVLIHVNPTDIKRALGEIFRCSKRYIFGFEYYADNYVCINYRGNDNVLWKTNFVKLYEDFFHLKLLKENRLKHLNEKRSQGEDLLSSMYLLELEN